MNIKRMSMILAGLVLCFVLAIGLIPGIMPEAKAGEYTDNGIKYTYNDTDHTATVIGYKPESISYGDDIEILGEITVNENNYTVNSIGDGALQNIQAGILHIPDSLISIGDEVFCRSKITSIEFGDSSKLSSIGKSAFFGCSGLKGITIPDSVTSIGERAFEDCTSLSSIKFTGDSQLSSIGDGAFAWCPLTSIEIPACVTTIVNNPFSNCSQLTSITVKSGNNYYSSDDGVLFDKNKTKLICYPKGKPGTTYTIPASVKSIGDNAFYECNNLTSVSFKSASQLTSIGDSAFTWCSLASIEIPASVTTIGAHPFLYCSNLTSITVNSENTSYSSSDDGVLFNKDKTKLICYPAGKTETSYTIPATVTSIGNYAFYYCISLKSVSFESASKLSDIGKCAFDNAGLTGITIPDSVSSIEERAFEGCESLANVTFGSASELNSIGSRAFSATGLTEITIPNSVTSIGEFAFSGWKLTCVISLPSLPPTLETNVFYLVDSGTPFFVYGPAYETAAGWSGFKDQMTMISIVTLNDGITATGEPPVATDSTGIYYKEGTALTLSGSDSGYCVIDTASKTNITKDVISGNVLTVPAADVIIAKNISHTVTFKVVNGAWNDQTTGDIVKKIIYSDYEDIAPVLQPEDIPPVGDSPAAGYKKEGSWTEGTKVISMPPDITIRSDHTYTYTYEAKATAALTVSQADGVYGTALADPAYTRPAGAIGNPVITYSGTAWDGSAYGPSSEKPAQAGGYTVSMREETADTVYSGSASFSVAPKSITDAAVSLDKTQMTYNGSEQHVSVTGVTINGLSLAEKDYEATGSTGTNVGSYSVKVTGKGNFKDTATTAWSIIDKAMMVAAGGFKGAYDGTEHGITVSVTNPAKGAEIRYGTAEGTYNLEASPTLTDAGAMTVYFIVTAENYADYTGSAAVTVTPKSITGAAASLDGTQLTYNGAEQRVNVTGVTIDGLSLAEKDYEVTGNTGTNAGSYSVEVTGKGNFKDSATAAWSIVGKAMTVTAEGFKGPYDGTEHGITVSVTEPAKGAEIRYDTAEGTYDLEAGPTLTDAGNLTVYFRVTAENYAEYTGSAAVQITAVPATVAAEAKTKVFETADPELTAVVAGVLEGEKLNYTLSRAAGENAGEYAIAVALGENPNYEVEAAGATFTITRAEAAVTKVPTAISGLVCNNTTQELVTAGTASGGTIRYALGEDSTTPPASGWNAGIPAGTDAGTYHVWYKAAGDENHTDSAAACVSVKIDPKKKDEEGIPALVTRCYRYLLGREPDADGKAAWIEQMESGNLTACGIMLGFLNSDEYKAKGDLTDKAFVEALYRTMLDRAPDPAGKAYWMAKLTGGSTRQDVIVGFCRSVEFNRISIKEGIKADSGKADAAEAVSPAADMRKIRAFVAKCYTYFLGREPDMDGLYYWADRLGYGGLTAVKTVEAFMTSDEFLSRKLSNESIVKALYVVMLNRSSDPEGEQHWTTVLIAGNPVAVVINGIASSPEFKGICEEYGMVAGALKVAERPAEMIPEEAAVYEKEAPAAPASEYTNEEKIKAFVEHCYKAVFGRDGDAEGVANYTKAILDGTKTPKSTAREFVFSSEFQGKLPGNEEFIRILYRLYFDREPGAEELSGWIQMLEDGASLEDIVNGFAGSEEFKTIVNEMK